MLRTTTRVLIWGIVALALLAVLLFGMSGHSQELDFGDKLSSLWSDNDQKYTQGSASIPQSAGVNAIEVDWVSGDVHISYHDGNAIEFQETASRTLKDSELLRYRVEDGRLIIQYNNVRGLFAWFNQTPSKSLELRIPHSLSLRALQVDSVSSNVDMEGTQNEIVVLSIDNVSGEIRLANMNVQKLDLNTVSGSVAVEGYLERVSTDTVSGTVSLKLWALPVLLQGDSVSADFHIALPIDKGFSATLDTISGSIRGDFADASGKTLTHLGGGPRFSFDTVSGSVVLEALTPPVRALETPAEPTPSATPTGNDPIPSSGRKF